MSVLDCYGVISATGQTTISGAADIDFPFEKLKIGRNDIFMGTNLYSISFTNLESYVSTGSRSITSGNFVELHIPQLDEIVIEFGGLVVSAPQMRIFDVPKLTYYIISHDFGRVIKGNKPLLEIMRLGSMRGGVGYDRNGDHFANGPFESLIDVQFGCDGQGGVNFSINTSVWWKPSNALLSTSSSLVHEGESFSSNKEKFLYNLKYHTLGGLYDRKTAGLAKLTITFSSVISDALTDEEKLELDEIVFNIGWSIAYA